MENEQNKNLSNNGAREEAQNTQESSTEVQNINKQAWAPGEFVKEMETIQAESDVKRFAKFPVSIIISLILASLAVCIIFFSMMGSGSCKCLSEEEPCYCGFFAALVVISSVPFLVIPGTILAILGVIKLIRLKHQGVVVMTSQIVGGVVAILQIPIIVLIVVICSAIYNSFVRF